MSKPVIFTISAAWDDEASVWTGHCDDIPAAATLAAECLKELPGHQGYLQFAVGVGAELPPHSRRVLSERAAILGDIPY